MKTTTMTKRVISDLFLLVMLAIGFTLATGCGKRTVESDEASLVSTGSPYQLPTLWIQSTTAEAGRPARFILSLSKPPRGVVRVQLRTIDSTGVAVTNYAPLMAELTIAPGDMETEIEIDTYIGQPNAAPFEFILEAMVTEGAVIWKPQAIATVYSPSGL